MTISMTMMITMMVISLFAISLSIVAAIFAFLSYSTTVGLRNSTHNIEYREIPVGENAGGEPTDKFEEDLKKILEDEELEHV